MARIDRPASIRHSLGHQRCPCADGTFAAATPTHGQALFSVEPLRALAVQHMAIAAQDDMQPSIPEPAMRLGGCAQHIA